MTRAVLAFATLITLTLNGSMAMATMPACGQTPGVCAVPLRMMTPPPPRPADLALRHAERRAMIIPVSGRF